MDSHRLWRGAGSQGGWFELLLIWCFSLILYVDLVSSSFLMVLTDASRKEKGSHREASQHLS